jgi:hypothetical protein
MYDYENTEMEGTAAPVAGKPVKPVEVLALRMFIEIL